MAFKNSFGFFYICYVDGCGWYIDECERFIDKDEIQMYTSKIDEAKSFWTMESLLVKMIEEGLNRFTILTVVKPLKDVKTR